jgi:hypothetical protein
MTAQIPVAHQLEKAVVAVPQISRESCSLNEALSCCQQRWSWFFDQFYAAQRSGMVFISRGKFCVWFSISINLVRGHQTVG